MNKGLMIATDSANINLNIDQKTLEACLKNINNFGHTTYMNICTGQSVDVPTGSFDWFVFFMVMAFFTAIGVAIYKALHD